MHTDPPYNIEVITRGRGGTIVYREGDYAALFDWDFGGGDNVAIIDLRRDAPEYPGGRGVLLARVAEQMARKTRCSAVIDERDGCIRIKEPSKPTQG